MRGGGGSSKGSGVVGRSDAPLFGGDADALSSEEPEPEVLEEERLRDAEPRGEPGAEPGERDTERDERLKEPLKLNDTSASTALSKSTSRLSVSHSTTLSLNSVIGSYSDAWTARFIPLPFFPKIMMAFALKH